MEGSLSWFQQGGHFSGMKTMQKKKKTLSPQKVIAYL